MNTHPFPTPCSRYCTTQNPRHEDDAVTLCRHRHRHGRGIWLYRTIDGGWYNLAALEPA